MTLPDVADIMEHILDMIQGANTQYSIATAQYQDASVRHVKTLQILYSGRCEMWSGYLQALSDLKHWIFTQEKEEPERPEKDCMWEDDE